MEMHNAERKCRCECGKRFKSKAAKKAHRRDAKAHMETVKKVGNEGRLLRYEEEEKEEEEKLRSSGDAAQAIPELGGVPVRVSGFSSPFDPALSSEVLFSCLYERRALTLAYTWRDPVRPLLGDRYR